YRTSSLTATTTMTSSTFAISFLTIPPPPSSTLFPYTTLFRSHPLERRARGCGARGGLPAGRGPGRAAEKLDRRAGLHRRRAGGRSEEHTSELQSRSDLVCRLPLEKKNKPPSTKVRSPQRTAAS